MSEKVNVIVYSAGGCGYCDGVRHLLGKKGVIFTEIRVDKEAGKREEMELLSQSDTVPQVFIDGVCVGGFDELVDLDIDNELDPLLGLA